MQRERSNVFHLGILCGFLLLGAMIASPELAAGAPVKEWPTEPAAGFFDAEQKRADQSRLNEMLEANLVDLALRSPVEVEVTAAELKAMEEGQAAERRVRVGLTKEVGVEVSFAGPLPKAGGAMAVANGALRLDAGGFVYSQAVSVPGASAVRLRFADFELAPGVELYLYNRMDEAFGPYTARGIGDHGDFWSHTLMGSEVLVQLHYRGEDVARALRGSSFTLAEAGYVGEKFLLAVLGQGRFASAAGTKSFCSFNESCVENASCSSVPGAVAAAEDAVGHMQWISGAFIYICSGGLVADTDTSSQIPYFLSANHCISRNKDARNLEVFFQFTTPCNGSCYNPDGVVPRTMGASIVSTNRTSDYTLFQLDQPAPGGSAFLGWTSNPVAFSNGTSLFRLSHPSGAPQAYSEHSVDTNKGTCSSWPRGNWIYSTDTFGATEGGSSGSPVLNSSGQIVGQLSGACGFNVNDPCDASSNATVDGAFAAYFSQVQSVLDPGTSCTDNDGDGFCSDVDCDDNNSSVNPGASEICGNSVDDDCDGSVDEGCGMCLPKGATCSANGDCCSNNCGGPPSNRTCKGN